MSTAQPLFFVGRKANHFFTQVEYVEELEQHRYTAYWGGEPFVSFLEKDQREVRNTLAVGLVAGGMRQSDVAEVLGLTRRQTARYVHGETSLTDGPGRPPLVTDEIRAFVRERYRELCAAGPRRWRKRVSELVLEKFHVRLQLPTLSALVADLSAPAAGPREQAPTNEQEQGDQSAEPAEASEPPAYRESPAEDVDSSRVVRFEPPADPTECAAACQPAASIVVDNEFGDPNRELVERLLRTGVYSRYAAALVLNPFVARLLQSVVEAERPSGSATRFSVESYLLTFLQMNTFGCNNYESIQQLHPEEFGPIIGLERSPSLATLYRMTPEVLDALDPVKLAGAIAGNYLEQLAIGARLFYVDGHVQRYFGAANLLRTFHPQTRQSQRSYVQYVLSAQDGAPVLMVDGDASVPFQDHIVVLVQQLLRLTPAELVPSVVFDRGGYDRKLLSRFGGAEPSADQLAAHYVSWEVGDRTDYSTHPLDWQEVIIELQGNDLEHPRRQRLMVAEAPAEVRRGIWTKDSPLSGLICHSSRVPHLASHLLGLIARRIGDWVEGSSMTHTKNPDYWGYDEKYPQNRLPYVDEIRSPLIPEQASLLAALRSGKVDWLGGSVVIRSVDQAESLERTNPEIELWVNASVSHYSTGLNVNKPPFDDIRVRKAMQMALDLEAINNGFYKGYGDITPHGKIGDSGVGYFIPFEEWPAELKKVFDYDPEGAEKLLDEAGYPRGADGMRFKSAYTLLARYDPSATELMASYWRGVDVEIQVTVIAPFSAIRKDRTFEMITSEEAWGSASNPLLPPSLFLSTGPYNQAAVADPDYDALYEAAAAATTIEEQQRLVKALDMYAIERKWIVWAPMSPLFEAMQPWVKGYNGEFRLSIDAGQAWARFWIDSELKESMGH